MLLAIIVYTIRGGFLVVWALLRAMLVVVARWCVRGWLELFGSVAWALSWLAWLRLAWSARGRRWLLRQCCCCTGGLDVDVVGVVAFGEVCSLLALAAQAIGVVALGVACSRRALAVQAVMLLHRRPGR